jgi:hypothetical protein
MIVAKWFFEREFPLDFPLVSFCERPFLHLLAGEVKSEKEQIKSHQACFKGKHGMG